MAPLRWGLLGTARINASVVGPLRALPRHELVAVASRSAEQARAYAAQWSIPQWFGRYEDLLAAPDVDVVYVPVPNGLHAAWTIAAARAGKHVLCEKPLAIDVEEVDAIAAAAREAGVVVAEAFMYRHHPQTDRVRALIAAGAVGRVKVVRGAFTFWLSRERDVRLDPALGGGSLWDVGCYPVSFARAVLGEEPAEALGTSERGPTGVDLSFAGQLRFPSGAVLQFDCGFRAHFSAWIEVVGTDAILSVPTPFKPGAAERVSLRRGDAIQEIEVEGQGLYTGELEDLADAVQLGRPPRIGLADSRANVAAILALYESARAGRIVPVERFARCGLPP
jgi:xylose dehydrogenase (NAD/NADP)